jgi:hypothetical protein
MTSPETTALLDDRYGRTAPRTRLLRWIVLGVLAAALVGYLAWSTVARSVDAVDIDTTGFHSVDDHSITVDFQVTLRGGEPLVCALEAQDTEHGIVGWRVVEYPADPAHTRRFSETIPTTALATTGLATSCWIP